MIFRFIFYCINFIYWLFNNLMPIPSSLYNRIKKGRHENTAKGILVNDISSGNELRPIPVINYSNNVLPMGFVYSITYVLSAATRRLLGATPILRGCMCIGECNANCACESNSRIYFDRKIRVIRKPADYCFYNDYYVQCGSHCGCRGKCKRQILPHNKVLKKLEIQWMKGKGFGVVAAQPIAAGMPIGEYVGEIFVERSESRLYPRSDYQQDLVIDSNFLEKNNKLVVDARRIGNVTRFINHSCFSNIIQLCVYPSIPNSQRSSPLPKVALIATRDILPGQELCYDYQAAYFSSRAISCLCYEPNCQAPPCDFVLKARSCDNLRNEIQSNKQKMHHLFRYAGDLEVAD